jgi:hypothetical protein
MVFDGVDEEEKGKEVPAGEEDRLIEARPGKRKAHANRAKAALPGFCLCQAACGVLIRWAGSATPRTERKIHGAAPLDRGRAAAKRASRGHAVGAQAVTHTRPSAARSITVIPSSLEMQSAQTGRGAAASSAARCSSRVSRYAVSRHRTRHLQYPASVQQSGKNHDIHAGIFCLQFALNSGNPSNPYQKPSASPPIRRLARSSARSAGIHLSAPCRAQLQGWCSSFCLLASREFCLRTFAAPRWWKDGRWKSPVLCSMVHLQGNSAGSNDE